MVGTSCPRVYREVLTAEVPECYADLAAERRKNAATAFKKAKSPPRITARRHLSCYVNHFLTSWKLVGQMGPADFQTVAVDSFIVWRPIFPAAKHDAYPFKSESTESGMMGFSALPQLVIAGPGPVRLNDRTAGKLMERLPQEFRTSQAPVNPNTLTTLLGHRGDSGKLLHLGGAFEAVAVGTESSQKPAPGKLPNSVESSCCSNRAAIFSS